MRRLWVTNWEIHCRGDNKGIGTGAGKHIDGNKCAGDGHIEVKGQCPG